MKNFRWASESPIPCSPIQEAQHIQTHEGGILGVNLSLFSCIPKWKLLSHSPGSHTDSNPEFPATQLALRPKTPLKTYLGPSCVTLSCCVSLLGPLKQQSSLPRATP